MTADLFAKWLLGFDRKMRSEKRKILLFIDNCTAHNNLPHLENIRIEYLPPNTTSKLQPLDQGIIQNFKCLYRKEVIRKIIADIETNMQININLLQAIRMMDKAWTSVKQTTIQNCFRKSRFNVMEMIETVESEADTDLQQEWETVNEYFPISQPVSFEDFVNFDNEIAVTGLFSDAEIINNVREATISEDESDDNGKNDNESETAITGREAANALSIVRSFFERVEGIQNELFSSLVHIENEIDRQVVIHSKQKK